MDIVDDTARWAHIDALNVAYRPKLEALAGDDSVPIRVPRVLAAVNRIFGRDTILMKENGGADLWCYYWPHYRVLDVDEESALPVPEEIADVSQSARGAV